MHMWTEIGLKGHGTLTQQVVGSVKQPMGRAPGGALLFAHSICAVLQSETHNREKCQKYGLKIGIPRQII